VYKSKFNKIIGFFPYFRNRKKMITGELGLNICIPKLGSMNLIAVEE
jgi:hypothetical protein